MIGATLFSGIGAPEVSMPHWQWPWHAEIEKFPSAVMSGRHPDSANLGDVTADDFTQRVLDRGRPDVLVFGSPCQSYSIAGKRLGLDDPRGNLALVALGIVDRIKPRWFVFENVPGLLSSSEGRDFGLFLRAVDELGYSLVWSVLDAQWRGVAQRRERVFAVGYLGDWRGPAAVLLEPESLCGHSPPRREAGQNVAPTIASRPTGGGGLGTDFDCDGELIANTLLAADGHHMVRRDADNLVAHALNAHGGSGGSGGTGRIDGESKTFVTHALRAEGFDASEDGTGRGTPIIAIQERAISENPDAGPNGVGVRTDGVAYTLEARTVPQAIAFDTTQITSKTNRCQPQDGDPCHPLAANAHPPAIAFSCKDHGADAQIDLSPTLRAGTHDKSHANAGVPPAIAFDMRNATESGVAQTLQAAGIGTERGGNPNAIPHTMAGSVVRRLTPRECERLQGFPDDYTAIEYRGKPAADGPRYKALGNSMAVPVLHFILSRIELYEREIAPKIASAA